MQGEGEVPLSVCRTVTQFLCDLHIPFFHCAIKIKAQNYAVRDDIVRCRSKKQMPKGSKQPQVASDTPGIGTWPRPHV